MRKVQNILKVVCLLPIEFDLIREHSNKIEIMTMVIQEAIQSAMNALRLVERRVHHAFDNSNQWILMELFLNRNE